MSIPLFIVRKKLSYFEFMSMQHKSTES